MGKFKSSRLKALERGHDAQDIGPKGRFAGEVGGSLELPNLKSSSRCYALGNAFQLVAYLSCAKISRLIDHWPIKDRRQLSFGAPFGIVRNTHQGQMLA